jgi:GTP pyrophosphokinase
MVVTAKARARIRRFIRTQQRTQYLDLGKVILQKAFRHDGHDMTEKALGVALDRFKCDSVEDLYVAAGAGNVTGREVVNAVFPPPPDTKPATVVSLAKARGKKAAENAVPIRGLIPGMAVHYAGCCHPLPGDRIVGIVMTGKGVTIHTIDCDKLVEYAETPDRWLDVAWNSGGESDARHVGRLSITIGNEPGSLGSLTTVIGRHAGNITNLKITNRSVDFFELLVDVEVQDLKHLTNIIAALRATPVINSVERARR